MLYDALRWEAGSECKHAHQIVCDVQKAKFTEQKSELIARFIEFWCQKTCKFDWRIEEYYREIIIYFENPRDYVLFKISVEYSIFDGSR